MSITPQIIEKEGKKEFVVLPDEEFLAMQEALEDFENLKELRDAKLPLEMINPFLSVLFETSCLGCDKSMTEPQAGSDHLGR